MEEQVEFKNQNGLTLVGTLSLLKNGSKDVVIICHGLCGNRRESLIVEISDDLLHNSICNTFSFDFNGNGDSEGEFSYGHYHEEVSDLRFAIEFLRKSKNLNVRAIIGHSKGDEEQFNSSINS